MSLTGGELEAGDKIIRHYPETGWRNNPASPDGGSTRRQEFSFEIRGLG
jgi:hypothetical protein